MVKHIICCLMLAVGLAQAQMKPSVRLEIQSNQDTERAYDVTPLGKDGVLVAIRRDNYYSFDSPKLVFQKYNTELESLWETEYKIDTYTELIRSCLTEQYVYWLFKKSDSDRVTVLRIDLADGRSDVYKGKLLAQMDISQFKVLDNIAYIGGHHHTRPVVIAFSFFDLTTKVLPDLYTTNFQLNNIEVDEKRRQIHVMIDATHKRNCVFMIHTYSYEGRLVRTVTFNDRDHSLISGKLLPMTDDESLLVGNYSTDCTPYSQGIYITRIRNGEGTDPTPTETMRYIDFSELQNFFNYMKPKRQQRMLEKIRSRRDQGKNTKLRYRLLVHDLIPTDEGLMLIAEVYYPQYQAGGSYLVPGNVRSFVDRYQEGYRYTHAFLCHFDKKGKLLWDNCVPIPSLTSYSLHPMVQVSKQGNLTILAYPKEGEINTKVIQGSKVIRERDNFSLKNLSNNEKIVYSDNEHLEAWYDYHFLACGFQKITQDRVLGPPREVFYINKLTYLIKELPTSSGHSSQSVLTEEKK